ncbi:GNAT family protein [Paenibacillus polygoni]|uniref:GNAT family protein n=1 Tax=Paenibacillus polygoni TaxID=3050112 RepID=A0ABY8X6L9_9BACL|nr:GNAT family protein [Paenibacillus polygoni]WIV21187.1 GNAT family protein [Paenibacillus polygoni]
MKLKGNRVTLSSVTNEDLDFLCELECNEDVWLYEEFVENDHNIIKSKYLEQMNSNTHVDFIMTIEADNEIKRSGLVQVWSYVAHRSSWELGLGILPEYQGYAYGYEAAKLMFDYVFKELEARKIVGMCNSLNQKSINLMEKLKMTREGTFKQELKWNDEWHDQHFYSILVSEWTNVIRN